eukprot:m.95170 g.95170  ORF g.95170 m.95170 type:complete len:101 (-) comp13480_c1_seq6:284-586(-)
MPYLIISSHSVLERGPTMCGDAEAPKEIMDILEAQKMKKLGNTFEEFISQLPPRIILNRLELLGFNVVTQSGPGQTCVWTLKGPQDWMTLVKEYKTKHGK